MPSTPQAALSFTATDVGLVCLVAVCLATFRAAQDRTLSAAAMYVVSLALVDLPLTRYSGLHAPVLPAVTLALLLLALALRHDLGRLRARAHLGAWLPLVLLLAWAALSGALWTGSSWSAWGRFARPALTSLVVLLAARRLPVARAMGSALVTTMAVLSAAAVVQSFWGRFFWSIGRTKKPDYAYFIELPSGLVRASGAFEDPNNMGFFAAVALLPVALLLFDGSGGRGRRRWLAGLALLLTAGMAASLTRSAALAAAVGLLLLWPRRRPLSRRLLLLLAAMALAAAAVVALRLGGEGLEGVGSVKHRLLYWRTAADLALEHPLTGVGLGNFGARFAEQHTDLPLKIGALSSHRPHNALLQMAVETGLPGLALFTAFVGLPFVRLVRRGDAAGRLGAALLATVLVHAALHNVLLQDLFWVACGVAHALAIGGPANTGPSGGPDRPADGEAAGGGAAPDRARALSTC